MFGKNFETEEHLAGQIKRDILLLEFKGEEGPLLGAVRREDICFDPSTLITATGGRVLEARANHPDMSLADLYNEATMPSDLREAHRLNDMAVCQAYGLPANASEDDIVQHLLGMYKDMLRQEGDKREKDGTEKAGAERR